jgi:hypothetical protein
VAGAVADSGAPLPPRRLLRGARNLQGLVGRTVLVGISFVDEDGVLLRREQAFGVVAEAADGVVTVRRADGEEPVVLPADEESFHPAKPGTYRLSSTGQQVVNPDYLTTWTVIVHAG